MNINEIVKFNTMVSDIRVDSLRDCVQKIYSDGVEGEFAECGTWRGGLAALMLDYICKNKDNRKLYIYDTFQGMARPTELDGNALRRFSEYKNDGHFADWCKASLVEVKKTLAQVSNQYSDLCVLIEGKVEETLTIQRNIPSRIALLRLDTDWYESTKKELEVLWPLVSKNGIVIVDDYSDWPGCKKAVDEYLEDIEHKQDFADGSLVITKL
jgi:O-methyltransferase